ncbi:MAG: type II toxin-antitoxin system MqsA family antitoxin [Aquidulcibacter sp.]|jgi:HTH-type transcriptional regulator/antitoxin MqsA|uniref:type II toxin-antitoxin system MqsA family antitoxin n=1 Tax=Aquidulcibacter sp. TaxID=2052990 RepID=UPI0022C71D16|nr:type II toxin-antitoxin system MqsA family antitoxin [Aquidulcibacter sp.]MCE2892398.1 type II toxin-antitoxin system MqsA family antitoxin [Hyphomonadaceae bacterium]MCZ8209590.1 type II toxin-antitoxin system MqsA family antitoxin [Aquidulcibacter sp.]
MSNPTCPETGSVMYRDIRPMTIKYKGRQVEIQMPGWYCDESDESIHTGDDMKISDRALNRLKAEVENLLVPETVRRIRMRLGLSQKDAGRLIGGGPNAFQKYESGDVLVSHGVASALLLLERDPSGLSVLKEQRLRENAA